ncbi:MAG TPA: hypothetical protein VGV92_01415 [Gammaproteobacteria bacterium]|nr:hypothetical protein [Gammaproteobacteria bacterium]
MKYNHNVFINCPFDKKYQPFEDAIIFTIMGCGFKARSAKESSASNNRLYNIQKIIQECDFAVHDISRTELDNKNKLPRFNMPFELGLFLGAKYFGGQFHDGKSCLIFDRGQYRYEKFISDIKGHDIISHRDIPLRVVDPIRNCLAELAGDQKILLGSDICSLYSAFCRWLIKGKIKRESLSFGKFAHIISKYFESIGGCYAIQD